MILRRAEVDELKVRGVCRQQPGYVSFVCTRYHHELGNQNLTIQLSRYQHIAADTKMPPLKKFRNVAAAGTLISHQKNSAIQNKIH